MTTTLKPSRTPYPGSASRRQGHALSLWAVAGNLHSTSEGAPGRPTSSGAGGKLRNTGSSFCRVDFNPR